MLFFIVKNNQNFLEKSGQKKIDFKYNCKVAKTFGIFSLWKNFVEKYEEFVENPLIQPFTAQVINSFYKVLNIFEHLLRYTECINFALVILPTAFSGKQKITKRRIKSE